MQINIRTNQILFSGYEDYTLILIFEIKERQNKHIYHRPANIIINYIKY